MKQRTFVESAPIHLSTSNSDPQAQRTSMPSSAVYSPAESQPGLSIVTETLCHKRVKYEVQHAFQDMNGKHATCSGTQYRDFFRQRIPRMLRQGMLRRQTHQRDKLCQAWDDVQSQERKEECAPEERQPQGFCVFDCRIEGRALQTSNTAGVSTVCKSSETTGSSSRGAQCTMPSRHFKRFLGFE